MLKTPGNYMEVGYSGKICRAISRPFPFLATGRALMSLDVERLWGRRAELLAYGLGVTGW
jgi:hypothetical protein